MCCQVDDFGCVFDVHNAFQPCTDEKSGSHLDRQVKYDFSDMFEKIFFGVLLN